MSDGDYIAGWRFLALAWTSFIVAAVVSAVITAAAAFIAFAMRLGPPLLVRSLLRASTFGYALPGTVVAVGVLAPLGWLDGTLDSLMRNSLGISTGLMLSGTLVALVFAYVVRFLAVAAGSFESGFARIPDTMDHVARTLGCTREQVMRRIHLPLLSRSALTAFVLVFADVLKELPATLIVRPFNFDTLAVRVYQLASDERLAQASTGALVIVLIGLLPIVALTRLAGTWRMGR